MNTEVSQGQREEVIKTAISKSASTMSVIYDIRDVAYWFKAIYFLTFIKKDPVYITVESCLSASVHILAVLVLCEYINSDL